MYTYIYIYGWWFQPLWKILASWDYYSQYMEKCSKPPTKYIHIYIYIVSGPVRAYLGWSHWKVPYDKHIWHLRKARRWKGRLAYKYIYTPYIIIIIIISMMMMNISIIIFVFWNIVTVIIAIIIYSIYISYLYTIWLFNIAMENHHF